MISYRLSDTSLTVYVNGEVYTVDNEHKNIVRIRAALAANDADALQNALDIKKAVVEYTHGKVSVKGGQVLYNGTPAHSALVDEILRFLEKGQKFEPLVAFLDNLMQNPSYNSIDSTFAFRKVGNLPITPDGCFLGYRSVKANWKDWYSGKVDNSVGSKPFMERGLCDDTRAVACSKGFHVGTLDYVRTFNFKRDGGHVIIVKVNPKDVVSVPSDVRESKLRVNTYEVVGEWNDVPLCDTICEDLNDYCRRNPECSDCKCG